MNASAKGPLLSVEDLRIEATLEGRERTLVAGVSLSVSPGEILAIVGESGSGKSLTARAVVGLLPTGLRAFGRVTFEGRDVLGARAHGASAVRGRGIGLVMQDPFTTLNPLQRCFTQLRPTRGPRRARREQREDAVRRLEEVGIHDPNVAERYPWQLSGGMRQRVALAAALANDPRVLVADEFSTALDVTTQKAIWLLLRRIQAARGMGLVIITHDLRMAFSLCDRVHVMYAGSMMEAGVATAVANRPMHPYTLGLLLSEPDLERQTSTAALIRGNVPRADEVLDRCAFSARCRWAAPECFAERPRIKTLPSIDRDTACVRVTAIDNEMEALYRRENKTTTAQPRMGASSGGDPLVAVRDLRKVFSGGRRGDEQSVAALAGVSLDIAAGESVGLVGESGSGKTTLARCLVGLEVPSAGSIHIGGIDASQPEKLSGEKQRGVRNLVQYVFQDPYSSLNPTATIGAALTEAVMLRLGRDRRAVKQRVNELCALVSLPESYLKRKPQALSGGERQRVAIARALALEPRLVICDEPVASLDVSVQAQVLELLNSIRSETNVSYLFITHDLAVVRQVADRIYVLYRGEIVEDGLALEVLERPRDDYTRKLLDAVPGQWDRNSGLAVPHEPPHSVDPGDADPRAPASSH